MDSPKIHFAFSLALALLILLLHLQCSQKRLEHSHTLTYSLKRHDYDRSGTAPERFMCSSGGNPQRTERNADCGNVQPKAIPRTGREIIPNIVAVSVMRSPIESTL
uniref:Uncharacterized protein n=1 Tax=Anopheles atroparvus TaxID=41427 RepID=A0A182J294_ANOAO